MLFRTGFATDSDSWNLMAAMATGTIARVLPEQILGMAHRRVYSRTVGAISSSCLIDSRMKILTFIRPTQIFGASFQKETALSRSDIEKQKLNQMVEIQNDIKRLKADMRKELSSDRDEITRLENQIGAVQEKITSDLQQIRELMTTLLDMGRGQDRISLQE